MKQTHTRDNADAVPHAVPLTFVPKISGVQLPLSEIVVYQQDKTHPYNTAHIVVELKLITTVLARIANGPSTIVNIKQKNAVKNVLAASDPRRPIGDSTKYAPSFLEI